MSAISIQYRKAEKKYTEAKDILSGAPFIVAEDNLDDGDFPTVYIMIGGLIKARSNATVRRVFCLNSGCFLDLQQDTPCHLVELNVEVFL